VLAQGLDSSVEAELRNQKAIIFFECHFECHLIQSSQAGVIDADEGRIAGVLLQPEFALLSALIDYCSHIVALC